MSTGNSRNGAGPAEPNLMRRVANASMAGSLLEWYDFYLYGFAAALVFAPLFFPETDPLLGTLASFGTFAVGFIARPVGGIIFGHFGDRIGRKAMLVITLVIMGLASVAIGLLPTYEQIGMAAPILLILMRILQGIGLGGEWGGAVLMVVEYSPENKQGWWGSVIQLGACLGQALATGLLFGFSFFLSNEAFMSWGWRVPFLLSGVLLVVGLFIRLKILETPSFRNAQAKKEVARFPLALVFRRNWRSLLACFGVYLGAITVPFFLQGVYLTSYGTNTLGLDRNGVLLGVAALHATLYCAVTLLGGRMADRIGPLRVIRTGMLTLIPASVLGVLVLGPSIPQLIASIVIFAIPLWWAWGALPAYFARSFPTNVRYSGISLSAQAATIGGGFVPIVLTLAVAKLNSVWPLAMVGGGCALIGLMLLLLAPRHPGGGAGDGTTTAKPLADDDTVQAGRRD
ncbi:MFS transporter [Arthrobacter mangrovi]|uniref:MFS transporter n=1 Tax=Arthrobacter mangrovi TaxID=2966350 RepID=A0ABQ5MYW5_9MICC|nr:MFS transporter [Arthrobacter mangrovi]GLB69174.1 MFS transporter [Arthrobacter mangrovi]